MLFTDIMKLGTHPQVYVAGTGLTPLQAVIASRSIDEGKHSQASNFINMIPIKSRDGRKAVHFDCGVVMPTAI